MEVKLLNHTPDALALLLRTKNTRLRHASDPASWSDAQRAEHLAYMRDTIKSSWEFVVYVFEISGVTRAFTHQLVRTRTGSYAQESQRTVDVRDADVIMPESLRESAVGERWLDAIEETMNAYAWMVDQKIPVQDARGILPINVATSIVAQFSLRTLHEMAKVRLCARTGGEYQDVFRLMRERVIAVHPWVEEHRFIEVHCVSEGTCAFPRYGKKECRFYRNWMDLDRNKAEHHATFWASEKQVAVPVVRDGKTM